MHPGHFINISDSIKYVLYAFQARYIRFIYNRVILENEIVRAAAVSALAKFGAIDALTGTE